MTIVLLNWTLIYVQNTIKPLARIFLKKVAETEDKHDCIAVKLGNVYNN